MKSSKNYSWALVSMLAISSVSARLALADDASVTAALATANASFSLRSATNPQPILNTLNTLAAVEGQADDSDLNYDVLILESRAFYWQGEHTSGSDDKLRIFANGQGKADQAKAINDGYADAFYFAAINLARWGETKGVLAALSRKNELLKYVNQAIANTTRTGQPGESIDGYGPDRVLGKVYFVLPGIFGGSHTESIKDLAKAYANAKNIALNVVYYAESLNAGDSSEKTMAKNILDELLSHDANSYNPARVPETLDEFEQARKLRASLN